ncbi:MAG: family 78 glycoside hydrolase catalytic domain [Mangrovibacterium sp.]
MKRVWHFSVLLLLFVGFNNCVPDRDQLEADHLSCEYFSNPLGVESASPMLGWEIYSQANGMLQSAYRILVADDPNLLTEEKANCWDSGKVMSGQSVQVPYNGSELESGKKYYWKVRIWDQDGAESGWSETAFWQMGVLRSQDWAGARWIGFEELPDSMRVVPGIHGSGNGLGEKAVQRPVVPFFRKDFLLKKNVVSATLFISGLGHYEAYLNGEKVGNAFLTPGWTDYDQTVFYNTWDVTPLLSKGNNTIGAIVGPGFYHVNRERYRKLVIAYGMPMLICRLLVTYADGSSEVMVSDGSWKTAASPVTYSSIYGGEDYDARMEQAGWDKPGFDDSAWKPVLLVKEPSGKLTAERDYPTAIMETVATSRINKLADTTWVYDFGQNASGIVKLRIKGRKGQQLRMYPAELIHPDGTANQRATGSPYCYTYTLKGEGEEVWMPRFSYYGFRYVQVEGAAPDSAKATGELPLITGMELLHNRNSAPLNGTFVCSNELMNRIDTLINQAIKSNFQSVLTDCPHREKLGWMEQTFLMGAGVNFNYDTYHLYRKLVYDMMDAQTSDGLIPDIAPEYVEFEGGFRDSPEWGSAGVILPWLLYRWYDDRQTMEAAWPMMNRYIAYLKGTSDGHIVSHGLGDWFDLGPQRPGPAQLTPMALTATAVYFYDVQLLSQMAGILGKNDEQKQLESWAGEIKEAFNEKFFDAKAGVYSTGSQTAMAMPLCVGLVEDSLRSKVLTNLVDSIQANDKALTAGDIGFHYLVEALTAGGASQLLFEMNNRDDVPGYGYQLKKGATTLTESWAALEEVSNNHLMLGHLMEWFYQGLGGIRQAENSAGYKELVIKPEVVGDLTYVRTTFETAYGQVSTRWEKTDESFTLAVEIPANTTAMVYLPVAGEVTVNNQKSDTAAIPGLRGVEERDGKTICRIGSGTYTLKIKL